MDAEPKIDNLDHEGPLVLCVFWNESSGEKKKKTSANSDGETVMYWYDTDMLTETGYFVSP